jgi:hypothetical protein
LTFSTFVEFRLDNILRLHGSGLCGKAESNDVELLALQSVQAVIVNVHRFPGSGRAAQ